MKLEKSTISHRGTHELNNQIRPKLYKETQVSREYNLSLTWLRNSRWRGDGPQFVKIGGGVFYRPEDVDSFIESRLRRSTGEY